jgi:hypothetical protein
VLTKGEPIAAPSGRADDFGWPRNSAVTAEPASTQPPAALVSAPVTPPRAAPATAGQRANANTEAPAEETKPPVRRRPPPVRTDNNNNNNNTPRPPLAINPSAAGPRGWWR